LPKNSQAPPFSAFAVIHAILSLPRRTKDLALPAFPL
jgi:hypothetical protein